MFFWRMISKALRRQTSKRFMIALTIFLGATLTTSMLAVMLDVGDKVKAELGSYGANIQVMPQGVSAVSDLYEFDSPTNAGSLKESELEKLKSIFWAYNIESFAPTLNIKASLSAKGQPATKNTTVVGTWFLHDLKTIAGNITTGLSLMRSWWDIDGKWPTETNQAMIGKTLAKRLNLKVGDKLSATTEKNQQDFIISAVFTSGSAEDQKLFINLTASQKLSERAGQVDRIEVRAITTPENELSRRAARDPQSLSLQDWETWYCTAYTSSIAYQIEEAMSNAVAKPVYQIADTEGAILEKTQLIMTLVAVFAMIGASLGIANLVTATVMERSREIGLMKALGARKHSIAALILTETLIVGLLGAAAGCLAGLGLAQLVGHLVFAVGITIRPVIIPVMLAIVLLTVGLGCLPSIRYLTKLNPTSVLHGR